MKDEELRSRLEAVRVVIVALGNFYENPTHVEALDAVLDPDNGVIAAKQAGWALAHERANLLQTVTAENELLKLQLASVPSRIREISAAIVNSGRPASVLEVAELLEVELKK